MKTNELRIGNLIAFNNHIEPERFITINARFFSSIAGGRGLDESNDELNGYYKPIPLTPGIIEKCNLESIPVLWLDDQYSVNLDFSHVCGQDTGGKDEVWVYFNDCKLVACEYLHHLQNVYHSLHGKELIIAPLS